MSLPKTLGGSVTECLRRLEARGVMVEASDLISVPNLEYLTSGRKACSSSCKELPVPVEQPSSAWETAPAPTGAPQEFDWFNAAHNCKQINAESTQ
jgi:hypothetical protein